MHSQLEALRIKLDQYRGKLLDLADAGNEDEWLDIELSRLDLAIDALAGCAVCPRCKERIVR